MVTLRKGKKIKQLKDDINNLEEKIEKLEEERNSLRNRYESAEEKRKKLAREKQNREEELNKLKNKLESLKDQQKKQKSEETQEKFEKLSFTEARNLLEKINSLTSPNKDLTSIYCIKKLDNLEDVKGLKNTLKKHSYSSIPKDKPFIAFTDNQAFNYVLKTREFYEPGWKNNEQFDVKQILDFVDQEKYWILVSVGDTKIVKEKSGKTEIVKTFKSRIDRKHSKGGFSQGRFERKREEQIHKHLKNVENYLNQNLEEEKVYILSNSSNEEFFENYDVLGGFDKDRKTLDSIYNFRVRSFNVF